MESQPNGQLADLTLRELRLLRNEVTDLKKAVQILTDQLRRSSLVPFGLESEHVNTDDQKHDC